MVDTLVVLDPVEADAQRIADAIGDSDPVFAEVLRRALRTYALIGCNALGEVPRGAWAVACLADALSGDLR